MALAINTPIALIGYFSPQKALTPAGVLHAWVLGVVVWAGLGWRGYLVVSAYFLLGTAVTKLGLKAKQAKGIAEKRGGSRGPENVWGSALTGAVCALGNVLLPDPLWWLAYAASFAAKLADTTSSEIGKAYGKTTFLITTWEQVPAGTEGAVSREGSLAGMAAAAGLTVLAVGVGGTWLGTLSPPLWIAICWISAMLATTAESWIGVVWQPHVPWLTNELVNGIQTTLAAGLAVGLAGLVLWV
ncbi:MAG: TIGR00297 family protein [Cyanobacteriota bacterium]|nr:TIGR00297 family protein [Cyanobacteriota bacterium]